MNILMMIVLFVDHMDLMYSPVCLPIQTNGRYSFLTDNLEPVLVT